MRMKLSNNYSDKSELEMIYIRLFSSSSCSLVSVTIKKSDPQTLDISFIIHVHKFSVESLRRCHFFLKGFQK